MDMPLRQFLRYFFMAIKTKKKNHEKNHKLTVHTKSLRLTPMCTLEKHGRLFILTLRGGVRNFYLRGPSYSTNIFIKTISHIHIYTCFFIIYTCFYLISYIYIYIYKKKKKAQYFQSKLCLMVIFHKIKFIFTIFIVKFLKNVIFDTNYLILY